jgi:long-chain acyl-CoA synthetase
VTAAAGSRTPLALLADAAARFPDRPAVADERGACSFAELARRVRDDAAILADAGVGRGDRVALVLPNSRAFVTTFLAALDCGAAVFPLNVAARPAEMRRVLAATPVAAVVAMDESAAMHVAPESACLTARDEGLAVARRRQAAGTPAPPVPTDAALVAYSSGTVARPHLVVRSHENLWWEAENFWTATRLGPEDVVLGVVPLSHAHGLGNALLAALRAGARLVLRPRFLRRRTLDLLQGERISVFPAVPFMIRMLAATDPHRVWDLSALRLCFSAGAPLTREVFDAFRHRFGPAVRQLYGLTEAGSVTLGAADDVERDPESVGRPVGNVRVTIEDDAGRDLPPGVDGEIVVRSPAAAGGAAPLRTRDRGQRSAQGALRITGRTSLFINTGGNKVDPTEVEAALRSHPDVLEVAVFGVPAPHGEQLVAAAVVPRGTCDPASLRVHCRTLLAPYKVPRVIRTCRALPRSPLGKVLIGRLLADV